MSTRLTAKRRRTNPPDPTPFCTELTLTLKAADKYLDGQHTLMLLPTKMDRWRHQNFPVDALDD